MQTFTLLALPALSDNYIWLLHDGRLALAVDPGQAAPVQRALAQGGLELAGILVTHHHADHLGGVAALHAATGAPVHGPAHPDMPAPSTPYSPEPGRSQSARLLGLPWQVMAVPGHTATHLAWFSPAVPLAAGAAPVLFCGDTLFSGGCGRVFEGTPAQMLASLETLAALPDDTLVCCGHEYTVANLRFACAVEPGNARLAQWLARARAQRQAGQPTLPAVLGQEKALNPFLRCRQPALAQAVRRHAAARGADIPAHPDTEDGRAVATLTALREWKNHFQ